MCNRYCEYIENFISHYHDPLYAVIPETFEEYFKAVRTDARTCWRRAKKKGYKVKKVEKITKELHKEICDIFHSKKQRQHRDIYYYYTRLDYTTEDIRIRWTNEDYTVFDCPRHYMDFYGCFLKDRLVAYLELLHSNELATVYSTMGHGEYLKDGIMKYMFLEVMKVNQGTMSYVTYGNYEENAEKGYFLQDLNIVNHNNKTGLMFLSKGGV